MARATANQWAQARALYEAGEPLRDIESATGIDNSNISKRAKKEGWNRGVLPQIIDDKVLNLIEKKAIDERITALLPQSREIVETAVIDKLTLANYFHDSGKEVAEIAMQALRDEPSTYNAKNTMETLKTGRIVTGLDAMHASLATINNLQQTNIEERKGENGFKLVFEDAEHEKP
ncbi:MAG: hypothetical protein WBI40_06645 [Methylococcaceae bacterium]